MRFALGDVRDHVVDPKSITGLRSGAETSFGPWDGSHQLVDAAYVSCDDGDGFGPCGHLTSKRPIRMLTVPY